MIPRSIGSWAAVAERHLRARLLAFVAMAAVALCAAVSLGFGTFAAYVHLSAFRGRAFAALMVSLLYALFAITIWAAGRRAGRARRATAAAPAPLAAAAPRPAPTSPGGDVQS